VHCTDQDHWRIKHRTRCRHVGSTTRLGGGLLWPPELFILKSAAREGEGTPTIANLTAIPVLLSSFKTFYHDNSIRRCTLKLRDLGGFSFGRTSRELLLPDEILLKAEVNEKTVSGFYIDYSI